MAYDAACDALDAAEPDEVDNALAAYGDRLVDLLETFAEDTADRNDRETVVSGPSHNGVVVRFIRRLVGPIKKSEEKYQKSVDVALNLL